MASDSSSSAIPSWQFMVLLAAAFGAFLTSGNLATLTPASMEPEKDKGSLVDAHLSDDPFGAWVRADKKPDAGDTPLPGITGGGLPAPIGASSGFKAMLNGQRVCLLPVVVRGDFRSTEAREMRIRFRVAAVAGLGAQGLVADDPAHLLLLPPPARWSAGTLRKPSGIDQPLPAEWFIPSGLPRRNPSPYGAVLVVWVQDQALFTNPLNALEILRDELRNEVLALQGVDRAKIDFKVIGPYWSGTLTDIAAERKAAAKAGNKTLGAGITFYSSTATMADGVLDLIDAGPEKQNWPKGEPKGRGALSEPGTGPVLVNLTCNDENLAEALINELMLRGVKIDDEGTRIAIISDWDTEYGRVLPLTFAAKLKQMKEMRASRAGYHPSKGNNVSLLPAADYGELASDDDSLWPPQVLKAFYISGVGGSASSVDAASSPDDSGKSGDTPNPQPLERAEGEHQVDYIARLGAVFANRLRERDSPPEQGRKASRASAPKLQAIGLLGSSVNDELLLLQVLRPRFPDAVFFTDKLDARFLDRGTKTFTRNLVVATTYGFELFERYQVGVAPFRSSEQTGAFLAVQAAAALDQDTGTLRKQLFPLRFEIGRTTPVPLFVPDLPKVEETKADRFQDNLHPNFDLPRLAKWNFWSYHAYDIIYMLSGAFLFGTMTVFVFLGRFKFEPPEQRDILAGLLLLGAALTIVPIFNLVYDGFEPLTWIEGVSIWPSEVLRLVAVLTAAGSLYYCGSRVKRSRKNLADEFGLAYREPILPDKPGLYAATKEVLGRMPLEMEEYLLTEEEDAEATRALEVEGSDYRGAIRAAMALRPPGAGAPAPAYISAQILWRYLCERSMPIRRYARAGLMTASYIAGWIFLFGIIGPPAAPLRGRVSEYCDNAVLIAASTMMVYLIFWVVDETQSCYRFVSRLGEDGQSLWPDKAFAKIPSIDKECDLRVKADRKAASAYVEVLFIGKLTAEAVPLIILPFVVITLVIFARWTFFANWHMPVSVILFCGEDAAICVLCALMLKNAATTAKERALRNIGLSAADARAAGSVDLADALVALQADMDGNQEGAFLPWHQQPFVRAVLLPFGGTGVLQAVEFMMSKP